MSDQDIGQVNKRIKIWGRPTSICTQRALWAGTEAGVEFELTSASATMGPDGHVSTGVAPYGTVDSDWYGEMNPNRTIPTIDDDDYVLWESNAIVVYLALQYGEGKLVGSSPADIADAMRWMSWTNEHLEPPLHTLVMELSRLAPSLRDKAKLDEAIAVIADPLHVLDDILARQDYLLGKDFSIADIPTGAAAYRWKVFDQPGPSLPNVDKWLARLGERAAFKQHVAPAEYHV